MSIIFFQDKKLEVEDDYYNMNHRYRGQCIIVNNVHFKNKETHPDRSGSDLDAEELKKVFIKLSFEVIIHRDINKREFKKVCENCKFCLMIIHNVYAMAPKFEKARGDS